MSDEKKLTKTIFCANCQEETVHDLSASPSGEVQATCSVCGRVVKFPVGISREDFDAAIEAHKAANQGQVTQESIEQNLTDLADEPAEEPAD